MGGIVPRHSVADMITPWTSRTWTFRQSAPRVKLSGEAAAGEDADDPEQSDRGAARLHGLPACIPQSDCLGLCRGPPPNSAHGDRLTGPGQSVDGRPNTSARQCLRRWLRPHGRGGKLPSALPLWRGQTQWMIRRQRGCTQAVELIGHLHRYDEIELTASSAARRRTWASRSHAIMAGHLSVSVTEA